MTLVLVQKLDHRNIELRHDIRGESVGVLLKDGEYRFLAWLGFAQIVSSSTFVSIPGSDHSQTNLKSELAVPHVVELLTSGTRTTSIA